jgi:hypothetical protein
MITSLQNFEVNSFYATQNQTSSSISTFLDVPQHYLNEITHFSITSATIPNTWTQLDHTDQLSLSENGITKSFTYTNGTYKSKINMMSHLQQILNSISPNSFQYAVTDNSLLLDDNAIKISVNDSVMTKKITLNGKYLKAIYGLPAVSSFIQNYSGASVNLYPISTVYIHSNICASFNSFGLNTSDIVASVNVHMCGAEQQWNIKENMKPFSGNRNMNFYLTDFDNYPLDLFGNDWKFSICFFNYKEEWIGDLTQFMNYSTSVLGGLI